MSAAVRSLDEAREARCRCAGDGRTWATCEGCPVHDEHTSPTMRALAEAWERHVAAVKEAAGG